MSSNTPPSNEPAIIAWAAIATAAAVFYRPLCRLALWLVHVLFLSPLEGRLETLEKRFDTVDGLRDDLSEVRQFMQRLEVALASNGIVLQPVIKQTEKRA